MPTDPPLPDPYPRKPPIWYLPLKVPGLHGARCCTSPEGYENLDHLRDTRILEGVFFEYLWSVSVLEAVSAGIRAPKKVLVICSFRREVMHMHGKDGQN